MRLQELQNIMKSGSLPGILIFHGEEHQIMEIYIKRIIDSMNLSVVHLDTVREAFTKLNQRTMLNNSRLILVREDVEFIKADKEWGKVFTAAEKSGDTLLLVYSKLDKRTKFYKQNDDKLCEFERLGLSVLCSYIQKELPALDTPICERLVEICDYSYSRILLECDKIKRWANIVSVSYEQSFIDLLNKGIIYQPIGDITFKFTDSILMRNKKDAFKFLSQAKSIGESEILTLSVLYSGFRNILLVQGLGKDKSEPSKRTGLTPFQVKLAKEKMGHYSIPELINALKVIRFVEKGIKTSFIDSDIAVEYVMINIM